MIKTIFIAGVSSGIGKAAALLFAEYGWKVIATMRGTCEQIYMKWIYSIRKM